MKAPQPLGRGAATLMPGHRCRLAVLRRTQRLLQIGHVLLLPSLGNWLPRRDAPVTRAHRLATTASSSPSPSGAPAAPAAQIRTASSCTPIVCNHCTDDQCNDCTVPAPPSTCPQRLHASTSGQTRCRQRLSVHLIGLRQASTFPFPTYSAGNGEHPHRLYVQACAIIALVPVQPLHCSLPRALCCDNRTSVCLVLDQRMASL